MLHSKMLQNLPLPDPDVYRMHIEDLNVDAVTAYGNKVRDTPCWSGPSTARRKVTRRLDAHIRGLAGAPAPGPSAGFRPTARPAPTGTGMPGSPEPGLSRGAWRARNRPRACPARMQAVPGQGRSAFGPMSLRVGESLLGGMPAGRRVRWRRHCGACEHPDSFHLPVIDILCHEVETQSLKDHCVGAGHR